MFMVTIPVLIDFYFNYFQLKITIYLLSEMILMAYETPGTGR